MLTRRRRYRSDRRFARSSRRPAALSNDVRMSDADEGGGRAGHAPTTAGVLANLPARARSAPARAAPQRARRRPRRARQRRSRRRTARGAERGARRPRRAHARRRARHAGRHAPGEVPGARRTAASAARGRARTREGFPGRASSARTTRPAESVQPPGGAELVASAAEIVGELAKAGSDGRAPAQGRPLAPAALLSDAPEPRAPAELSVYCAPRRAVVTQVAADGGPNADRIDPLGRIGPAGP